MNSDVHLTLLVNTASLDTALVKTNVHTKYATLITNYNFVVSALDSL